MMQNKNVLIVEDEEVVQKLLKLLIEKRGASVTTASSAKEAEQIFKQKSRRFDLISLDLILPEVTGWDILERIRSTPETRDTPVIIFTGAALSAKEEEKMLQKANAVIEKSSFTLLAFDKILDQWL